MGSLFKVCVPLHVLQVRSGDPTGLVEGERDRFRPRHVSMRGGTRDSAGEIRVGVGEMTAGNERLCGWVRRRGSSVRIGILM